MWFHLDTLTFRHKFLRILPNCNFFKIIFFLWISNRIILSCNSLIITILVYWAYLETFWGPWLYLHLLLLTVHAFISAASNMWRSWVSFVQWRLCVPQTCGAGLGKFFLSGLSSVSSAAWTTRITNKGVFDMTFSKNGLHRAVLSITRFTYASPLFILRLKSMRYRLIVLIERTRSDFQAVF